MSSNRDEVIDWLASVSDDPLAFVYGAYPWGEGELAKFDGPDDWQVELLTDIRDGVLSIQDGIAKAQALGEEYDSQPIQLGTTSGHGIGKSALVAWIIDWAQSTLEDTKGVVTANTENQLKTKTWAELAKWHRLSVAGFLFKMTATARFSIDPDHEKTWRIDMVPWSEKNTEAFAGLHNAGKRILIVFDEASAIPDVIWEVTEGALTDKNTEIIWAVFGNPTRASGRFRDCFPGGKFAHRWKSRAIDSRTVKITNKVQLNAWVADYGEDHDFVRVRVRGVFPRVDANSLISFEHVQNAQARQLPGENFAPVLGALDVARYGSDWSVMAVRQGRDARSRSWSRWQGLNTLQLAARAFEEYMRLGLSALIVDEGGVGGGVLDQLESMGIVVYGVDFGSKPEGSSTEKYLNKRAEMWGRMADWVKEKGCLPPDRQDADEKGLSFQLTAPTFTFQGDTKMQLESKKDIRRRLGISPDDADALAMTFAFDWLELALPLAEAQSKESSAYAERNPYAQ